MPKFFQLIEGIMSLLPGNNEWMNQSMNEWGLEKYAVLC